MPNISKNSEILFPMNDGQDNRRKCERRRARADLSRDDMLFLLSVLEGELQARDEVIAVLKSERTDSALLKAHYGFIGLEGALRSLHGDLLQTRQQDHLHDVYKTAMYELMNFIQSQKRSNNLLQEQLLEVSNAHWYAVSRSEVQQGYHRDFVQKNKCFTTLLEDDQERLKLLIVKERQYQELKETIRERDISLLKEELKQLKAFASLLVKEHKHLKELHECHVKELSAIAKVIDRDAKELWQPNSMHPEAERHSSASCSPYAMTAQLADGAAQNQPLRHQHSGVGRRTDALEETRSSARENKAMQQPGDRETRQPSSLSEVEVLRRRVVEMEGKDEELIRMRDQCRDLDSRLVKETKNCSSLKIEVNRLNGRISELDRIEETLGKSKQECCSLRDSLEKERDVSKMLSSEVDSLKLKVRELEASELQLEKSEVAIRHDLATLRSLTAALAEDRKTMSERLQEAEEKLGRRGSKNSAGNTREENVEQKITGIAKERDELQTRLAGEQQKNVELESKMSMMRKRLQVLENRREKEEKYTQGSNNASPRCQTEENKAKQLMWELERLQKRLQDKEMMEKELMKVEDSYESLEKSFKEEQIKSMSLLKELDLAKKELSSYKQAEKQDVNQEHLLLCRLQKEQVKSRLLGREVSALKEQLQQLMGTEESISRVQTDHSTLQGKLMQQEVRNRELAREMRDLSSELDRYRRLKNEEHYRPTKEVQTEPAANLPPDCQLPCIINETFSEKHAEDDPNHNAEVIDSRGTALVSNLNSLNTANNIVSQNRSHAANGVNVHQAANGDVMMLAHTPGQPLQIKVTPHHILNTATLEISSPTTDASASYTSTAFIPSGGNTPNQRITIIQNKSPPSSPDRSISLLNGTPVSRMMSPNSSRSATPDLPIQILTVRTCSPEPADLGSQASFCKTPDRQNSWHHVCSGSPDSNPSIITTEDNKIHIHLGNPYLPSHSMQPPVGPYYLRHEQRTQVLANGCHVKGVGKITSSITISPATSPASHSPM
ncbi:filamin A-interacting protein 1-like isoform X2 [Corythoichthys intestinalis]|uniref:filamin A-interacting protein 1-like isoform X2 n=1 Tax=Corythoichthys intestinalis TaxID=161448 RepID=UPI0025A64A59|nr:filamin A-interacting protein 1-like isoform X2 [Corythoichthys intestinalis]XP_057708196.1 filamin A-interacting protein 1-like isoform X2 [Corythoichthys intestinalis]